MRKALLIFNCLLVLCGCAGGESIADTSNNEDFQGEYFVNFAELPNIIYYLGDGADEVLLLKEESDRLIFCFEQVGNINYHDESIRSYANYIKNLEKQGYLHTGTDGTVISSHTLTNDNYTIEISTVSVPLTSLEYFDSLGIAREIADEVENQNMVFKVEKN